MNPRYVTRFAAFAFACAIHPTATAHDKHTPVIAATCFACHGSTPSAFPRITGLAPEVFIQSMKDFQSGARAASIMQRHALAYTDAEIAAMAAYFAALPAPAVTRPAAPAHAKHAH